ncbi:2-dehydropantoate 2-reductase [Desulfurella amilsii]|uniref:2-dehydropantoate 2-reductase n=1 Tax=Desulfurella amilsii TaxID=1562698 RepID=A0A1X4XVI6_9BACT|nr:ketopantoate reductase C-terminal domain-containing protein [Desulfurella amilsii]OSS41549.1 2-dehydropantoate 2-reductase [Desulfurella amilsii]
MKILIYGSGALGLLMGYHLKKENDVFFIGKTAIQKTYKIKKGPSIIEHTFDIKDKLDSTYDCIILATKSFDVDKVLENILKATRNTPILTIQNGIYVEELLLSKLDKSLIFPIASLIGATKNEDTINNFMDNGQKLGYFEDRQKALLFAQNFNKCGLNTAVVDNIMSEKWWKFIFYCSCATINALTGIKSFDHDDLEFSSKLAKEIAVVFSGSYGLDLDIIAKQVIDFAKNFKPDTWKASVGEDLRKCKKTEIDYLNGYVVKVAKQKDKSAPYNESLYNIVKILEKTKLYAGIV